ncbi:hypothetical protein FA13DRAFT_1815723 [Coprinellus micaceus]|uniref:Uncharacterized protein n=1 Tax=Coprinellus micaceus TaxID=71717 RepID=A0A4Y7T3B4_COPMI|nr:hypothetical protein FA13DRAFT_1815723 [Coprinellus micaceus]
MSAEEIQALTDAVAMWRTQEYMYISFYCSYVYYILTTMAEEVSIIIPQGWSRGKTLYTIIRYGTVVFIVLHLSRDFRNYFSISPNACKMLVITFDVALYVVTLTCDFSLALCLSALLQAKPVYLAGIVILSCGIPFVNAIFTLVSEIQYPAEPASPLDRELGYICYIISAESAVAKTAVYLGRDIRSYVGLVATTFLAVLGVVTIVVRYKGQGGRLVQVISRDGGLHYLSLLAIRVVGAIVQTGSVLSTQELDANPVYILTNLASIIIIPTLAQRLLINMRKVDYMGSEPIASKLLFAASAPGSEDDLEFDSFELAPVPSGMGHRGPSGNEPERGGTRGHASTA